MAAVHFFERFDDGFALGLGFRVPHRIAQRFIGNIHRRFHADIFAKIGISVNVIKRKRVLRFYGKWNPSFFLVDMDRCYPGVRCSVY